MDSIISLLKTIPAIAWSALATGILTSIFAFLGVYITNRENLKRMSVQHEHEHLLRKNEIFRERAEHLYILIQKYCNTLVSDHFLYIKVMRGEITYNKALDITTNSFEKVDYDAQYMRMIADIYFPELSKQIDSFLSHNNSIFDIRKSFILKAEAGINADREMAGRYASEVNKLSGAGKELVTAVKNAVREICNTL